MNTAKIFSELTDVLQRATVGIAKPWEIREALNSVVALQAHHNEQLESLASFLTDKAGFVGRYDDVEPEEWEVYDAMREKATELRIEARTQGPDHQLPVYVWSRDCDMCEGSSMTWIEPTLEAYNAFCDSEYECAEGPMSIHVMTRSEVAEFKPEHRDRALEAWENGRGANAWTV